MLRSQTLINAQRGGWGCGGGCSRSLKCKSEALLTLINDPVCAFSAVYFDFEAAGAEMGGERGEEGRPGGGGEMGEGKGLVLLPERLESEKASSNHHGKVAAVRGHCARTDLLSMLSAWATCGSEKAQLFPPTLVVPLLLSHRDKTGETSVADSCLRNFTRRFHRGQIVSHRCRVRGICI